MAELTPLGQAIDDLQKRLRNCETQLVAITDSVNALVQVTNHIQGIEVPAPETMEPELLDANETMPGWYECRFQTPFGVCKIGPVQTPEAGVAGAKAWMAQQGAK